MKGHLHTKNMSCLAVCDGAVGMAAMIGIVLLCLLAACSDRSVIRQPGPVAVAPGQPSTLTATCPGADLSGLKIAVYVKVGGTDGNSCGLITGNACKTIQQGINNCAGAGCGVLVRHGLYPTTATITLRNAVSVYGSCLFDDETDRKYRTTIQASPAPGTPAISASAITTPTTISGLVVIGKDETANGTASIAMAVSDSIQLTLTRSMLVAGKGGDGAAGGSPNGDAGGNGFSPGCDTCPGGGGGNACPSNPPASGVGSGGEGAGWNNVVSHNCFLDCGCYTRDLASSTGRTGQSSGSAAGGSGYGPGSSGCNCGDRPSTFGTVDPSDGTTGGTGGPGSCSAQGGLPTNLIWGQANVQGTTWLPSSGGAGVTASVGAGGGGGGSGGYATDYANPDLSGYPGGGGGGGGCGGPGGTGGQQGGASLALLLSNAALPNAAQPNSVVPGPGGRGGVGGTGGLGGPGGTGGPGFHGPKHNFLVVARCAASAAPGWGGAGGPGGPGGAGGGGAGGNGGPSIGIALRGSLSAPASNNGIYVGTPGVGGAAGSGGANPNCTGAIGADGIRGGSAAVFNLDLPFSSMLFPGLQLAKGQGITSPDGKVGLAMQGDDNLCLYSSGNALWCTETNGDGIPAAIMQTDGNLCLYPTNGDAPVCSGTAGHPDAYLIVQNDGHVQIIDGGTVLWSKP